jgi:glycosyltransferase involved in cell wall biosynthesis
VRFHVVGLPWTNTTKAYSWCAYTTKVRRFCDMMTDLGHEVILYAGPENEAQVSELVSLVIPKNDPANIPEFTDENFEFFDRLVIQALSTRLAPRDFICIIGGYAQRDIAEAYPGHMSVEYGVGYAGTFSAYRVFESYAWMHMVYGQTGAYEADGHYFDAVIPNYFDPKEFKYSGTPEDYFLYIGRLIDRKGWRLAVEVTQRMGVRLILAGAGDPGDLPDNCTYVGVVDPEQRSDLLGGAVATFVPTQYIEPFGGVHVESMLCGTPVITTDWGVFTETVTPKVGFRCRSFREFCEATKLAPELNRRQIRRYALSRFSTEVVAPQYEMYFQRLLTLWEDGFYA